MIRPNILAVDDDPQVLSALDRDLRERYGKEYRILKAASAREAMDAARELKKRNNPVALFLVDQRMPETTGMQFLGQVREIHPDARKVLLTAYADTEVAIQGINAIGLDHYLMKPWDPPEQRLFPVLDDLLAGWASHVRLPFDGIRIAGARFSPASFAVRDFLSRNQVPYQWIDVDEDAPTRALIAPLSDDLKALPVVLFPDGSHLSAPTNTQLAEKIGLHTRADRPFYDVAIIGGGPAGLANAVYAATEGMRVVLIEQNAPGGQAGTSSRIENYLGFPAGISGADLAQRASAQARRFGAELLLAQQVVEIRRQDPYRIVALADGSEIPAYAVLIATGMSVRTLDAPGIEPLLGRGVYYGTSISEAVSYRGQDVCIVGGANSAGQSALFFSQYARRVTIVIRAEALSPAMSHYLVERIHSTENIDVISQVEVAAACGEGHLEQVVLRHVVTGEERRLSVAAMFIAIGTSPHSEVVAGLVEQNEKNFILTGPDLPRVDGKPRGWTLDRDPLLFETNVPGIFAAGDVRAGANRRVAAAVGEGSAAIYSIHRYLRTV